MSSRVLNKLASFWPQSSQVRHSSSSAYSSMGGSGWSSGFHLVKLDEVAVADCSGDIAGAIMFVAGALQNQEHAD